MLERRRSYLRRALAAGALLAPLGILPLCLVELSWVSLGGAGFDSLADGAVFAAASIFVPMGVFVLVGLAMGPVMLAVALLAQRLAQQRLQEPRWMARIYAVLSAPLLAYVISLGLAGRRAQQLPVRWLIALVLGVVGVAGVYGFVRLTVGVRDRFRIRRWGKGTAVLLAALSLCAAAGLYALDQRVLVGLYAFLHVGLALGAAACSQLAIGALYAAWRPTSRRLGRMLRPRLALVVGAVLVTSGSMAARQLERNELLRFVVFERTALQRKLMVAADAAGVLRAPAPAPVALQAEEEVDELNEGPRLRDANVVLITVDALRADRLQAYGAARQVAPQLDRWARGAVVFQRGYCPTPTTSFSLTALITGCRLDRSTRRVQQTLPAVMRRYGYKTGGFFPPSIFYIDGQRFERFETTRFDFEYVKYEHLDAAGRVDQVLDFLRRYGGGKFFVWVHFFEPHHPYESHEGLGFGGQAIDRYDSEVAYVDREVGRLLDVLDSKHPRTVVALTADHGEAFGEHGMHYHGSSLYEEQIRVPLMVSVPASPGRMVEGPAQTIDLPVTLLRLVDIPAPPQMEGRDLGPWIAGAPSDRLPAAFVEYRSKKGIVTGRHKLIYDTALNFSELYDLSRDPAERDNLVARERGVAGQLRGRLLNWLHPPRRVEQFDPEARIQALLERTAQGQTGTVEQLVELYQRGDGALRREVVLGLVRLRASRSRDLLVKASRDSDPGVAIAATIGAALFGDGGSLERIWALLERPDLPPDLRRGGLVALARHKKDRRVTGELSEMLSATDDVYQRFEIIEALGASGDPAAAPALRRQLATLRTRLRAINALGQVRAVEAVPQLIRALKTDQFLNWRKHAAFALGRIGDRRAIAPLGQVIRAEPESVVVGAAIWALWRLKALPRGGGVRPLPHDGSWRCVARRCKADLGVSCAKGAQLLLLLDPPPAPVEVRCGGRAQAVMPNDVSERLAGADRLALPALVTELGEASGRLSLVSASRARVRYAGLRRVPPAGPVVAAGAE